MDRIGSLPPELVENIFDKVGPGLMDMDEAKKLRLELMAERSSYLQGVNEDYEALTVDFCEH